MSWPEMLVRVQANFANLPSNSATSRGNEVVGGYEPYTNRIIINRAVLQRPYLLAQFENENGENLKIKASKIYNIGALGNAIAHEMAHSLDPISIKKTATGQVRKIYAIDHMAGKPFTDKLILQKYNRKIDCLRRQYANYWIEKERKNSEISILEDFADNLGLQIAHKTNEDEEIMGGNGKGK